MFIRIPDPNFFYPGSRVKKIPGSASVIRTILTQKLFLNSRKYDPKYSSWIRILDPDLDFLPIPDPGSRGQKGTRSQIPDPDPQHWFLGFCLLYSHSYRLKKYDAFMTVTVSL
jgi:hypothetical protein